MKQRSKQPVIRGPGGLVMNGMVKGLNLSSCSKGSKWLVIKGIHCRFSVQKKRSWRVCNAYSQTIRLQYSLFLSLS